MDKDKVKVEREKFKDEIYAYWYTYLSCNGGLIVRKFKYCPHCGKEIDWLNS